MADPSPRLGKAPCVDWGAHLSAGSWAVTARPLACGSGRSGGAHSEGVGCTGPFFFLLAAASQSPRMFSLDKYVLVRADHPRLRDVLTTHFDAPHVAIVHVIPGNLEDIWMESRCGYPLVRFTKKTSRTIIYADARSFVLEHFEHESNFLVDGSHSRRFTRVVDG